jgi:hypothetical protein
MTIRFIRRLKSWHWNATSFEVKPARRSWFRCNGYSWTTSSNGTRRAKKSTGRTPTTGDE